MLLSSFLWGYNHRKWSFKHHNIGISPLSPLPLWVANCFSTALLRHGIMLGHVGIILLISLTYLFLGTIFRNDVPSGNLT